MNTPLTALDDAVAEFLRDTDQLSDGGFVTGWVLSAATARLQADDDSVLPMITGATYTFGPQTSVTNAAGLAQYLVTVCDQAMRSWQRDD